ncbi:hypothetical protein BD309DRAFT_959331 [Dichomitus squalens]|uniref:Uncharacterized protein n=1 Tax=Dichomitus squalens TaxID=114155 RepID=A0A4Q9NV73_9APHY|nr:hypothetical protein BD309DRAFT_959331 [Dichomitus squalens]TBU54473.1 hypothetical protein BD310DRAFT_886110 [Dichomitus squalens]
MSYSYYNHSDGRSTGYRTGGPRGPLSPYRTRANVVSLPPDRSLMDGLHGEAIRTLSKPQVDPSTEIAVRPENVKYIGSYNWVEEASPTIIVPGSPAEWRDRPFPYRVPFDTDFRFVDQNGYRMGQASCLLPLFRAVDVVAEENADTSLDWSSIDIITDRNGLRKLMRWLQYSEGAVGTGLKEFRIDLQLAGRKTVLMSRWEKRTRENADPPRSGCGSNFEKESTRPATGCERSTGHHRIVQYDMGGLKMIVRCEVDACIPEPSSVGTRTRATFPQSNPRATSSNVDDLTDMLSSLNVTRSTSTSATSTITKSTDITVIHAGVQRPQSSIVELTTRSVRTIDDFDWTEQYPQLLLAHVPHVFLAVHERGNFERIKKHELGAAEFRNVENNARLQRAFRQLVGVLRTVQNLAKEHGRRGRLSLVCRDGRLEVFERTTDQGAIPDSELERFGV